MLIDNNKTFKIYNLARYIQMAQMLVGINCNKTVSTIKNIRVITKKSTIY